MPDPQLDPSARELLTRYRVAHTPPADALARVRDSVGQRIAAGDPGMPLDAIPRGSTAGWRIGGRMAGVIAGGTAVVAAAAALTLAGEPHAPAELRRMSPGAAAPVVPPATETNPRERLSIPVPPARGVTDRSHVDPVAGAPTAMHSAEPDHPAAQQERPPARVSRPRPDKAGRDTPSRSDAADDSADSYDQVKAEMALLGRAQGALQAGDAADALRLLERHARKYPKGYLAEERMLQRMVALCELGRTEAARLAVRDFLKSRPNSPMASNASLICKQRPGVK